MSTWGRYCSHCGQEMTGEGFPRRCANGHMTFLTSNIVGVALQPVILNNITHLLIVKRNIPPCIGEWALPGGYAENDDTTITAALRELEEETGVRHTIPEPPPPTISVFWQAVVDHKNVRDVPSTDPRNHLLQFITLPPLDHRDIDMGFICDETQALALVHRQGDGLINDKGEKVTLCFSLHQKAALRLLTAKI